MIKQVFTLLFLLIFSHSAFATDVNTELCKDKVAVLLDKERRDQLTEQIQDLPITQKISRLSAEYGDCIQSPMENDISVEVLAFLFGEGLIDGVDVIISIFNKALNLQADFNVEAFKQKISDGFGNNYFLPILVSINTFLFGVALTMSAYFSIGFITRLMSGNKIPEFSFFAKTFKKSSIAYSLIAPIPAFGGLSVVQFLFLFFVSLGIFITKFLYTIIVFAIAMINFDINASEEFERSNITETFIERVENNVHMHLCDIQQRELAIEQRGYSFNNKYSKLAEDEYYKCLISPNTLQEAEDFYFIKDFTPNDIKVGEYCAKVHSMKPFKDNYCGNLFTTNDKQHEVAEKLGLYSANYQRLLREIALSLREIQCKNDIDGFVYDTGTYNCMKQNINGEYLYDKVKDRILYIDIAYADENELKQYIQSVSNKEYARLHDYFKPRLKEVFTDLLFENQEEALQNEVENIVSLINKGWFLTGSVYFEKNKYINDISTEIELIRSSYNTGYDSEIKDELTNQEGSEKRKAIDSVFNIFSRPKPVEQSVHIFDIKSLIASQYDFDGGCSTDLNKCSVFKMNSYLALSQAGNEIMSDTITFSFGLSLANKTLMSLTGFMPDTLAKAVYSISNVFELAADIFQSMFIIGFILGVIIPFIPFFYFLSKIVAWLLSVVKTMIVIPLVSLYFLIPNEGEEFEGHEIPIYKLIKSVIFQPLFILVAFVVAFFLSNVLINLFNLSLSILVPILDLKFSYSSIWTMFQGFVGMMLYTIVVSYILIKCCDIVNTLPRLICKWIDIEVDENQIFGGLRQHIQGTVLPFFTKAKLFNI